MNVTKRIDFFWGKQKSVKKTISWKYNFFSMVSILYSHWQQGFSKNFLIKESYHKSIFRNISFNYSHHFFVPHWSFITNISAVFIERRVFCDKKVLRKRNFLFYLRNSLLPIITLSKRFFIKTLTKKKQFFPNYVFYLYSYVAPMMNHTKPI